MMGIKALAFLHLRVLLVTVVLALQPRKHLNSFELVQKLYSTAVCNDKFICGLMGTFLCIYVM